MVLGNREKYVTTSETQKVLKKGCVVCTLTSDYHEFSAVILVDTNGSEVKLIKQSVTKYVVKEQKKYCRHRIRICSRRGLASRLFASYLENFILDN